MNYLDSESRTPSEFSLSRNLEEEKVSAKETNWSYVNGYDLTMLFYSLFVHSLWLCQSGALLFTESVMNTIGSLSNNSNSSFCFYLMDEGSSCHLGRWFVMEVFESSLRSTSLCMLYHIIAPQSFAPKSVRGLEETIVILLRFWP